MELPFRYISRVHENEVVQLCQEFPAVVITGPRQVGKTTLTQAIRNQLETSTLYLDLERPEDLSRIENLEAFAEANLESLIILDEIQRKPSLFPELRSVIDRNRRPGRFLLLGSASIDLLRDASESLAGRIAMVELGGLTFEELQRAGVEDLARHWSRGGLPESYLARTDAASVRWRNNFVQTYLERDLAMFGLTTSPVELRRIATMLAHLNGATLNYAQLSRDLAMDIRALKTVIDYFEQTFLIRRLPPYFVNIGKRLVKSPKLFFRDTGILHALLNIQDYNDLLGRPNVGASWEAYVLEQITSRLPFGYEAFYYRTQAGAEIDLVITRAGLPHLAVEMKLSQQPKLSKGFYSARTDIGTPGSYVVCPISGPSYVTKDEVNVIGIGDVPKILP